MANRFYCHEIFEKLEHIIQNNAAKPIAFALFKNLRYKSTVAARISAGA
jgi:hypothetical protein